VFVGLKIKIPFKFRKAHDYPIDVYYLLDFSFSMKSFRDSLINLSDYIIEEMARKTTKLQMGFGSFVDKVTLPFTYYNGPEEWVLFVKEIHLQPNDSFYL